MKMKLNGKQELMMGAVLTAAFALWTWLIRMVDVQPVGVNETDIGFATVNTWFHKITGVHMWIYTVTDWLGLVPILICLFFGGVGMVQLIKRKSLFQVDGDIIQLGIYYVVVIFGYALFEMIPINYRPILIEGFMEASYPSSTTLLVVSVMPTLALQANMRLKSSLAKRIIGIFTVLFSAFMVVGRLISGVHWLTDIVGGLLLGYGLFYLYKGTVHITCHRN